MRIFLSFNAKDAALAAMLRESLSRLDPNADIFFAPASTLGQGFWLPKLAQEIDTRDAFLLLLGPRGVGPWQEVEYHEAFGKHVLNAGFALVPVVVGASPVPGLPFLTRLNWVEIPEAFDDKAVNRVLAALKGMAGPTVSPLWKMVQPYRGLEAMTEANADYFFGRATETKAVLTILANQPGRLPILIGASGVGKSSIARAGVMSALKAMRWPGQVDVAGAPNPWPESFSDSRTRWAWLVVRPGDDPLHALASSFTRLWLDDPTHPDRGPLARQWAEGLRGPNTLSDLIEATRDKLEHRDGVKPDHILLYLDQAEELYTGAARTAPKDARRFSEVLAEGLTNPLLSAFASLRADFYDRLQADTPLFAVQELVNVPPLTRAALVDMVAGPAKALGVRFEDELMSNRIVEATAKEPGALPLLSYLLTDMWSEMVKRGDGVLRLPASAIEVGGVLAATAEKFLKANPVAERSLKRLLTLKLTLVPAEGDPLRRQARRSECLPEEWSLAEQLAEYPWRLVVTGEREGEDDGRRSEITAEVAHEALLRAWPRLVDWLRAEREFLIFKGDVERADRRWRIMKSPDRALLSSLDLDRAAEWMPKRPEDLSTDVRAFIQASIAFDRANKKKQLRFQRQVSLGSALAALILAGLVVIAALGWKEAEEARRAAQVSLWVANSRSDLRDGRVASAIGYAARANKEAPNEVTRSALVSALLEVSPNLQATFDVAPDGAAAMTWTDLDVIAFAPAKADGGLHTLSLAKAVSGSTANDWPNLLLERVQDRNVAAVRAILAIDPDRVIAVFDNGAVAWFKRGSTAPVWTPPQPTTLYATTHAVAIGKTGTTIVTTINGGEVTLITCMLPGSDPPDCQQRSLGNLRAKVVAISPDETRIAVGDENGAVTLFDRAGQRVSEPMKVGGSLLAIGWASARDWLAVGNADGEIAIIDVSAPGQPQIAKTSLRGAPITTLAWSPGGLDLAFTCEHKNICLWPATTDAVGVATFAPIRRYEGHTESVTRLAWSLNGEHFASASLDNTVRIWSRSQNIDAGFTLYAESTAQITTVATAPEGRWVAAGATDGTIRIWDAASGSLLRTAKSSNDSDVAAIAWARSGLLAAAHDRGGITLVTTDARKPVGEIPIDTDLNTRILFAEDDKTIAMPQHSERRILLIDVGATGIRAPRYLNPIGPIQVPWGLAVDPSGRTLFASYTDANGEIRIWDLASRNSIGSMEYTLSKKRDLIAAGSLSVDSKGRWLATSGGDSYVRVYDLARKRTWKALSIGSNSNGPRDVAFSPDGTKLAVLDSQNGVYIWSLLDDAAELYAKFDAFPRRTAVVETENRERTASSLAWITNNSIALATGGAAIYVVGLDPVSWRHRVDGLFSGSLSRLN